MAVMKQCCCCGVRQGSVAVGVYSMILGLTGALYFGYSVSLIGYTKDLLVDLSEDDLSFFNGVDLNTYFNVVLAVSIIAIIILAALAFASALLLLGINKDSKMLLVPYMVVKAFNLLWYLLYFTVLIYFIVALGYATVGINYLATIVLLVPFLIADIVCLLCVISQYQNYRDDVVY